MAAVTPLPAAHIWIQSRSVCRLSILTVNSTHKSEELAVSVFVLLTSDVEADGVLGILHPVHDLTAVEPGVARPQPHHDQRGVPDRQRMAWHRHPAHVLRPHLDHPSLGHQHHLLPIFLQLGPLDPQILIGTRGGVTGEEGRRCRSWCGVWRREWRYGEVAGQHHPACQRAGRRRVLLHLHRGRWRWKTGSVCVSNFKTWGRYMILL